MVLNIMGLGNKNMNLTIIAGARPNFIKIAPIIYAIFEALNINEII